MHMMATESDSEEEEVAAARHGPAPHEGRGGEGEKQSILQETMTLGGGAAMAGTTCGSWPDSSRRGVSGC